ncbi:glycosyltransferase family 4 protein [Bdellovibrio sp. HCB288]|uniref:glycosyltransferase family 4 protein n=1 Tax=Bdellovibrio sp. HCB288 TaxID=3394355 RepID=UPI0039B432AD
MIQKVIADNKHLRLFIFQTTVYGRVFKNPKQDISLSLARMLVTQPDATTSCRQETISFERTIRYVYNPAMFLITIWPFLISLLISVVSIPVIIRVADAKHLMDEPDSDRKLHLKKTPTLGGIAIFAGTVFSFSFFSDYLAMSNEIRFMTSALVLLFFAGIKDDILLLAPLKKLLVQIACALLITLMGKLYLTNLWGMLGITEIPPYLGIILTVIAILALINAYNLIDGVNGLAGGLGLITSLFFGFWFYLTNSTALCILSFSLAGSLLGFLFFNFHNAKIFMGDTGSMLLGFIISILAIKFIETNRTSGIEISPYYIKAAPGVAIAATIIPLIDLIRVFFQRLAIKRHPFSADRRHIHHILEDCGMTHTQISVTLYLVAIMLIGLSLALRNYRSMDVIIILSGVCAPLLVASIFYRRIKKNR